MNGLPRLLLAAALLASLAGGCSKKSAETAETKEPEQAEPAAPEPKPAPPPSENAPVASTARDEKPAPATASQENVPADLFAADAAYEAWFKKHSLDLNDPKMLDADIDGDGFTNREEFLADTDPRDPNSRPGVAKDIHLKEFVRKDLPYILKGVQGDAAQIEREDGGGAKKVETLKQGQPLTGSTYKIARVQSLPSRDKDGNPIDGSRVTLEDPATKQRVDLVKDLPARSSASYAVLAGPDGRTLIVTEGQTFTWPSDPPVTYKVKDLRAEQVILEEQPSRKVVTVARKP